MKNTYSRRHNIRFYSIITAQFLIVLIVISSIFSTAYCLAPKVVLAVYFYSSTCNTCREIEDFIKEIKKINPNLEVKEYDILKLKNRSLLNKYSEKYSIPQSDFGTVPVIFIHDKYILGSDIKSDFQAEIDRLNPVETIDLDYTADNSYGQDVSRFSSFKFFGIVLAGLLNGINPCSMSMLLFLASLITVKNLSTLKIGFAYIIGKFLTFLLLGTILFNLLSMLNVPIFHTIIKIITGLFVLTLIILNLRDYFFTRHENYGKVKVQLPTKLRKFNHKIIKKIVSISNTRLLIFFTFIIGIIVSFGEFLCTGQVYLATIVTVLQAGTKFNLISFIYFIVYNLFAVIPLMLLVFVIHKGKAVFVLSEFIRQRLHIIKLLYVFVFAVLGAIIMVN